MRAVLGTSGAETLSVAANVFVGQTEAPLVIRPYVAGMTQSELFVLMVGGFATVAGGVLGAYVGMGIDAGHLITASVISAPAAILIAKVMEPETETPKTLGHVDVHTGVPTANAIEAAAEGASTGMMLAINVAAMLIAFVALVAMANAIVAWTGTWFGYEDEFAWSLTKGFGYAFAPFAWLMGIERGDCFVAGQLLGTKTVLNEFLAYSDLAQIMKGSSSAAEGETVQTLSKRSAAILTYALCGFSNFSSIGIQIGGIGTLAPTRRTDLARLGLRAMIGGTLACFMTACVAGVLL
jgi:CNT family concentrative nucleoside transporter